MLIRKGDTVYVRTGSDKGKTGRVLHVFPKKNQILVEGVNMRKKHQRPSQKARKGGIVTKEAPIHISNVALYSNALGGPTKISSRTITESGGVKRRIRVDARTGEEI
ncbi:MAG: 50S ribosomal protein L24 [candidate division Zixibacteria bacterium]|jgi:large subunit ribosomal protein L24|nr:50S ribosomal protein L24 [candidate division Zixibacteria bacterium]